MHHEEKIAVRLGIFLLVMLARPPGRDSVLFNPQQNLHTFH